jgi:hypothetical protein
MWRVLINRETLCEEGTLTRDVADTCSSRPVVAAARQWPNRGRHHHRRKPENLRRYFKPSPAAMRGITSLLGPEADRH